MKNFKIITLSLALSLCSYQIIYVSDYKALLDASYNLLLDKNNDENNNENNVVIQSDNQNTQDQQEQGLEEITQEITTEEPFEETQDITSQNEPIKEATEFKEVQSMQNQPATENTTQEESTLTEEPVEQTTTENILEEPITEDPAENEVEMVNTTEQTSTTEPTTTENSAMQTLTINEEPVTTEETKIETPATNQDSGQLPVEDKTISVTEQAPVEEPAVITTTEDRTQAVADNNQDQKNEEVTAATEDLGAEEETPAIKSMMTTEVESVPAETIEIAPPVAQEEPAKKIEEVTLTEEKITTPVIEQAATQTSVEEIPVENVATPVTEQNLSNDTQVSTSEQIKVVKVYPVLDAARLGMQKVKAAAQSMLDYLYELLAKKNEKKEPEVKVQYMEEFR